MSPPEDPPKSQEITEKSILDLANSIQRCKGHYSFLIGAGTSKSAGIPTGGELVESWQKQKYVQKHKISEESEIDSDELEQWVEEVESEEMSETEGRYGFWFEKQYPTRGERRKIIRSLVEDAEPTFGHIVLASLMDDGYIPLTLTPNFDDILYDAFYYFLERKPLMVNHNAIAPQFRLTQDRPTIIKLHGDYLYDNLKNTNTETIELEKNIEKALSRSLDEYGLVVAGYSGRDDSIMGVLNSEDVDIPDYGLYWCGLDKTNLSQSAKELLQKPNTFFIEIDGFEDLLNTLYTEISDVSVPMPHEIGQRANEREQMLTQKVAQSGGKELLQTFMSAQTYAQEGNYNKSIDLLDKLISTVEDAENHNSRPSLLELYDYRGMTHCRMGRAKNGVEDYTKTIELADESVGFLNRAEAKLLNNQIESAKKDIKKSEEITEDSSYNSAGRIFLSAVAKIMIGEDYTNEVEEIQSLSPGEIGWEFETMEEGMDVIDIEEEKKEKIQEMIDELREKKHQIPSESIVELESREMIPKMGE